MEKISSLPVSNSSIIDQSGWDYRVARIVSTIGTPVIVILISFIALGFHLKSSLAWRLIAVQFLFSLFIPFAYHLWILKTGKVSDFDITIRIERYKPYIVMIGSSLLSLLALILLKAPSLLIVISAACTIQISIMFLINFYWKISGHTSTVASFAALLCIIGGNLRFLSLLFIPLMSWSRVRLKRHTLGQTIAGALLGISVFFISLLVFV